MKLHIVEASIAEPGLKSLPFSLSRSERMLETCGLNPMLLEKASGLVPLHAAEEMIYRAHAASDDPCWAFNVLRLDRPSTGAIANIPLPRQTVALDGVRGFVDAIGGFLTGTQFFLDWDDDTFWIKRTVSTTDWSDSWALVFYNFTVFLAGIRAILGDDVRAVSAAVASPTLPGALPPELDNIPIALGARHTGLGFDRRLLSRPPRHLAFVPERQESVPKPNLNATEAAITQCLSGLLASNATDRLTDRVARAFGLSRREYQRQLAELGTTHRDLATNARLLVAIQLLDDESWSVAQISYELGYRHPGDFTRFFRARTGVSPKAYRRGAEELRSTLKSEFL